MGVFSFFLITLMVSNVCFASEMEKTTTSNEWTKTITFYDLNFIWKSEIKFKESFNVYLYYSYDETNWVLATPDEINKLVPEKTLYLKVETKYSTNRNSIYSECPFKNKNHSLKKSPNHGKLNVSRETVVILEDAKEDFISIATMNGNTFIQTLIIEPYEITSNMRGNEISISVETTPFDGYISDKEHPNIKLANNKVFYFVVE